MEVRTRYARSSGDLQIAYQVVGDGPLDVVIVPAFMSNIEIAWELPDWARFLERLSSFARLIVFDRRGNGMSDGIVGAAALEEQIDDVHAVIDAVGSEQPALISTAEGCALATLFAASHPRRVQALVLITPLPRLVQGPGYEWAQPVEERDAIVRTIIEHWGSSSPKQPWSVFAGQDEQLQRVFARYQRLSMGPSVAAASLAMAGQVDVRDVLPSVQCPTLVLRREHDTLIDVRHSRYVADHISHAKYAEVPGDGSVWGGGDDAAVEEIEHFLTGTRRPAVSDRVLATVLFTDIVGSTERAAALGDGAWRSLLERHDALVREEVKRHRGRVVKSLGDGSLAVFDGPSRAISSAIAIRDGARGLDMRVRAGLHTGECERLADGDVGGLAVHIGARISSLARPGEVLVSSTVRDLVVGSGLVLADRGEQRLKGVPDAWRIFAVEA
jgi:class 3 adenylate cyclase